jgi:hypothetical protein
MNAKPALSCEQYLCHVNGTRHKLFIQTWCWYLPLKWNYSKTSLIWNQWILNTVWLKASIIFLFFKIRFCTLWLSLSYNLQQYSSPMNTKIWIILNYSLIYTLQFIYNCNMYFCKYPIQPQNFQWILHSWSWVNTWHRRNVTTGSLAQCQQLNYKQCLWSTLQCCLSHYGTSKRDSLLITHMFFTDLHRLVAQPGIIVTTPPPSLLTRAISWNSWVRILVHLFTLASCRIEKTSESSWK